MAMQIKTVTHNVAAEPQEAIVYHSVAVIMKEELAKWSLSTKGSERRAFSYYILIVS